MLVFSVTPSKIKIKTEQQIKSRIWNMKGGKYAKTLGKIQVSSVFFIGEIFGEMINTNL